MNVDVIRSGTRRVFRGLNETWRGLVSVGSGFLKLFKAFRDHPGLLKRSEILPMVSSDFHVLRSSLKASLQVRRRQGADQPYSLMLLRNHRLPRWLCHKETASRRLHRERPAAMAGHRSGSAGS